MVKSREEAQSLREALSFTKKKEDDPLMEYLTGFRGRIEHARELLTDPEKTAFFFVTLPEAWEPTARLAAGQRTAWPDAELAGGGTVDLSRIPGPEAGSHDDVFLTDLDEGRLRLANDELGLAFELRWNAAIFPWVVSWQPYGGAQAMPLQGSYALGLEPWVAGGPLAQAVADGSALEVAGGSSVATEVRASVRAV